MVRRWLALFLAMVMLATVLPFGALAEDMEPLYSDKLLSAGDGTFLKLTLTKGGQTYNATAKAESGSSRAAAYNAARKMGLEAVTPADPDAEFLKAGADGGIPVINMLEYSDLVITAEVYTVKRGNITVRDDVLVGWDCSDKTRQHLGIVQNASESAMKRICHVSAYRATRSSGMGRSAEDERGDVTVKAAVSLDGETLVAEMDFNVKALEVQGDVTAARMLAYTYLVKNETSVIYANPGKKVKDCGYATVSQSIVVGSDRSRDATPSMKNFIQSAAGESTIGKTVYSNYRDVVGTMFTDEEGTNYFVFSYLGSDDAKLAAGFNGWENRNVQKIMDDCASLYADLALDNHLYGAARENVVLVGEYCGGIGAKYVSYLKGNPARSFNAPSPLKYMVKYRIGNLAKCYPIDRQVGYNFREVYTSTGYENYTYENSLRMQRNKSLNSICQYLTYDRSHEIVAFNGTAIPRKMMEYDFLRARMYFGDMMSNNQNLRSSGLLDMDMLKHYGQGIFGGDGNDRLALDGGELTNDVWEGYSDIVADRLLEEINLGVLGAFSSDSAGEITEELFDRAVQGAAAATAKGGAAAAAAASQRANLILSAISLLYDGTMYSRSFPGSIAVGGRGDDCIFGTANDDAYIYSPGDGCDTILDLGGNDALYLMDVNMSDVSIIVVNDRRQQIRINGQTAVDYVSCGFGKDSLSVALVNSNDMKVTGSFSDFFFNNVLPKAVSMACPVEMEVLDGDGNVVLVLQDGEECSIENEYGLFEVALQDGEYVKTAILYDDSFTVRGVGKAEGTMTYQAVTYDPETAQPIFAKLENIPVSPDAVYLPVMEEDAVVAMDLDGDGAPEEIFCRNTSLTAEENLTLEYGESHRLSYSLTTDSAEKRPQFLSADPEVVSVDEDGSLTAVGFGKAEILVMAQDGSGKAALCTVTVPERQLSVEDFEITGLEESYDYTGEPLPVELEVRWRDETLVEGRDYTAQLSDVLSEGSHTLTITGEGRFTGTRVLHYEIVKPKPPTTLSGKVKWVADQCRAEGITDDYEIALWLHDWLINNANYDYTLSVYRPEGVLIYGTGVCQSYAEAYQLLLNEFGIPNVVVRAYEMDHAWNIVKLDGEWCHIDCTWDDPGEGGFENHDYFGLSDEMMMEDHIWNTAQYPACTTYKNYYGYRYGEFITDSQAFRRFLEEIADDPETCQYAGGGRYFTYFDYMDGMDGFSMEDTFWQWVEENEETYCLDVEECSVNGYERTAVVLLAFCTNGTVLKRELGAMDWQFQSPEGRYRSQDYDKNAAALFFVRQDAPEARYMLRFLRKQAWTLRNKGVEMLVCVVGARSESELGDYPTIAPGFRYAYATEEQAKRLTGGSFRSDSSCVILVSKGEEGSTLYASGALEHFDMIDLVAYLSACAADHPLPEPRPDGEEITIAYNGNRDALLKELRNQLSATEPEFTITGSLDESLKQWITQSLQEIADGDCCVQLIDVRWEGKDLRVEMGYAARHDAVTTGRLEPTCTEKGQEGDSVCTVCGTVIRKGSVLPALGHQVEYFAARPNSCEEEGYDAHYGCVRCGRFYRDETGTVEIQVAVLPPLGHDLGEPVYHWEPDGSACTVTCYCNRCSFACREVPMEITHEVLNPPTTETMGTTRYSASLWVGSRLLISQLDVEDIPTLPRDTPYIITIEAGEGGSVRPSGRNEVWQGWELPLTIHPARGYLIEDVLVDGVSVGAVEQYTFTEVDHDHTVQVMFRKDEDSPQFFVLDLNWADPDTGINSGVLSFTSLAGVKEYRLTVTLPDGRQEERTLTTDGTARLRKMDVNDLLTMEGSYTAVVRCVVDGKLCPPSNVATMEKTWEKKIPAPYGIRWIDPHTNIMNGQIFFTLPSGYDTAKMVMEGPSTSITTTCRWMAGKGDMQVNYCLTELMIEEKFASGDYTFTVSTYKDGEESDPITSVYHYECPAVRSKAPANLRFDFTGSKPVLKFEGQPKNEYFIQFTVYNQEGRETGRSSYSTGSFGGTSSIDLDSGLANAGRLHVVAYCLGTDLRKQQPAEPVVMDICPRAGLNYPSNLELSLSLPTAENGAAVSGRSLPLTVRCGESELSPDEYTISLSGLSGAAVQDGVLTLPLVKKDTALTLKTTIHGDPYKRTAALTVTVKPVGVGDAAFSIKRNGSTIPVEDGQITAAVGDRFTLLPSYTDNTAEQAPVFVVPTYKGSSDTTVAAVDSTGLVTVVGYGACTITVAANDAGKWEDEIAIFVVDGSPRLPLTALTMDRAKTDRAELPVETIDTLPLTGATLSAAVPGVAVRLEEGTPVVTIEETGTIVPAGKYLLPLTLTLADGSRHSASVTLTVTDSTPKAAVKVTDAGNLFLENDPILSVTVPKNVVIRDITAEGGLFQVERQEGTHLLVPQPALLERLEEQLAQGKTKGSFTETVPVTVTYEGYRTAFSTNAAVKWSYSVPAVTMVTAPTSAAILTGQTGDKVTVNVRFSMAGKSEDYILRSPAATVTMGKEPAQTAQVVRNPAGGYDVSFRASKVGSYAVTFEDVSYEGCPAALGAKKVTVKVSALSPDGVKPAFQPAKLVVKPEEAVDLTARLTAAVALPEGCRLGDVSLVPDSFQSDHFTLEVEEDRVILRRSLTEKTPELPKNTKIKVPFTVNYTVYREEEPVGQPKTAKLNLEVELAKPQMQTVRVLMNGAEQKDTVTLDKGLTGERQVQLVLPGQGDRQISCQWLPKKDIKQWDWDGPGYQPSGITLKDGVLNVTDAAPGTYYLAIRSDLYQPGTRLVLTGAVRILTVKVTNQSGKTTLTAAKGSLPMYTIGSAVTVGLKPLSASKAAKYGVTAGIEVERLSGGNGVAYSIDTSAQTVTFAADKAAMNRLAPGTAQYRLTQVVYQGDRLPADVVDESGTINWAAYGDRLVRLESATYTLTVQENLPKTIAPARKTVVYNTTAPVSSFTNSLTPVNSMEGTVSGMVLTVLKGKEQSTDLTAQMDAGGNITVVVKPGVTLSGSYTVKVEGTFQAGKGSLAAAQVKQIPFSTGFTISAGNKAPAVKGVKRKGTGIDLAYRSTTAEVYEITGTTNGAAIRDVTLKDARNSRYQVNGAFDKGTGVYALTVTAKPDAAWNALTADKLALLVWFEGMDQPVETSVTVKPSQSVVTAKAAAGQYNIMYQGVAGSKVRYELSLSAKDARLLELGEFTLSTAKLNTAQKKAFHVKLVRNAVTGKYCAEITWKNPAAVKKGATQTLNLLIQPVGGAATVGGSVSLKVTVKQ